MSESDKLDLLIELFGWSNDKEARYHALLILRGARREAAPSWSDFAAGVVRCDPT